MASQRSKSALKLILKLALSALAIYLVFRKVDLGNVWALVKRSNPIWLTLALLFFNISKVLSAKRLLLLFQQIGVQLTPSFNLKLYYIGMFYNLFLPGGIGGDGYKVYYLKQRHGVKTAQLISAVFLDRLSGAAILAFLALAIAIFSPRLFIELPVWSFGTCIALTTLCIPVLYALMKQFFKAFANVFTGITTWSLAVQGAQLISAFCILQAYGVEGYYNLYFILFLVSSIAAMLPISFGGIGLRELVFLYAAGLLPIDGTTAVALGLMFFLITALSSFVGVGLKLPEGDS